MWNGWERHRERRFFRKMIRIPPTDSTLFIMRIRSIATLIGRLLFFVTISFNQTSMCINVFLCRLRRDSSEVYFFEHHCTYARTGRIGRTKQLTFQRAVNFIKSGKALGKYWVQRWRSSMVINPTISGPLNHPVDQGERSLDRVSYWATMICGRQFC